MAHVQGGQLKKRCHTKHISFITFDQFNTAECKAKGKDMSIFCGDLKIFQYHIESMNKIKM